MPGPIGGWGCELLSLLPNSPNLSPIKGVHSRLEALLQQLGFGRVKPISQIIGRVMGGHSPARKRKIIGPDGG